MKTFLAVSIILAQFRFALAGGENSLRNFQDDITSSDMWDVNEEMLTFDDVESSDAVEDLKIFKKLKGFLKCIPKIKCSRKGWKIRCRKTKKCFRVLPKPQKLIKKCIRIPKCTRKGWRVKCKMTNKCFSIKKFTDRVKQVMKKVLRKKTFESNVEDLDTSEFDLAYEAIENGDIETAKLLAHAFYEAFVSEIDNEDEKAEMLANKSKILAALDVAVEHYKDDEYEDEDFEDSFDEEEEMDLATAIKMIDTIPDEGTNKKVHDLIKSGDIQGAEKLVHDYYETFVSEIDNEDEKAEMLANKSKILAALDVAVEHYKDDEYEDEIFTMNEIENALHDIAENQKIVKEALANFDDPNL